MNALSEMVVGTSAGAYMGSSLTSGQFLRLRSEFEFFGHFPSLFAQLTALSSSNASQQRAVKLSAAATDGEISTLQTIGRAALAADNRVNGDAVSPRLIWMLTGDSKTDWPVAKIYTSAVDCYTCGDHTDPWRALEYAAERLGAQSVLTTELRRGIAAANGRFTHVVHEHAGRSMAKRSA